MLSYDSYDISGYIPEDFEVGNVYLKASKSKVYYMAISKKTLVTYKNGHFGKFTTKKEGHTSIGISVAELCNRWKIKSEELDTYMSEHFQPDESARVRARKSGPASINFEELLTEDLEN